MPVAPDFVPAPDKIFPKTALISLSDKSDLLEVAKALLAHGVSLISTGGTRAALEKAGLEVTDVSDLTGFPEMMDGRVKTLHPKVHGALLAYRDAPSHAKALADHDITPIDIVWIDLYPFEATVKMGADFDSVIENIDIGGPAMIRSAAKNHAYTTVCVDKEGVDAVIESLKAEACTTLALRRSLAAKAFGRTAYYDAHVAHWFNGQLANPYPDTLTLPAKRLQTMRYGENPHQSAAFYSSHQDRPSVATAKQIQGKALSYNNVCDADAALELVSEFAHTKRPACVIVKHANPCGVALGDSLIEAYRHALSADPVSAFGGIVALSQTLDAATAELILETFTEVVIAPAIDADALAVFSAKKNVRLLITDGLPDPLAQGFVFRSTQGGVLIQSRDTARLQAQDLRIVTKRQPSPAEIEDMIFAFTVAKHVKSNAIVYAKDSRAVGIGAGQMNRRDSARIASMRALEASKLMGLSDSLAIGSACASEAFFPFPDGLLEAVSAGASCVIQPGGSIKDADVIAAADEAGIAMAFTDVRVFKH